VAGSAGAGASATDASGAADSWLDVGPGDGGSGACATAECATFCAARGLADGTCVGVSCLCARAAGCTTGATATCYAGPLDKASTGACKPGSSTCEKGGGELAAWGPCVGQVLPTNEVCANGVDEDCNGVPDDAAACNPDAAVPDSAPEDGPCMPRCAGKCKDAPDECGGSCSGQPACAGCCDATGACVPLADQSDTRCGANQAACADCKQSGRSCNPMGSACTPPCTGHLKALAITSGDLGGIQGANALCATAFGPGWHVATITDWGYPYGNTTTSVCTGNWCEQTQWNGVVSAVMTGCDGFTSTKPSEVGAGYSAITLSGPNPQCASWGGQWSCDGTVAPGHDAFKPFGLLCTDL
jgi:hypothetical protein